MFKFLFGDKSAPTVKPETNRERFARLVSDLNEMIDTLPNKPKVTLDPATGHILPETPEQFADEALALPKPTAVPEPTATAEPARPPASEAATDAVTEGDAVATIPRAPVPNPPKPNPPTPKTGVNGAA